MTELELVVERCAGIDVHQAQLRVCVRLPGEGRRNRVEEFATFGTTTPDLLELSEWLSQRGVTQVAMEGTGVYWKPVYYVLEADFDLWLVNAQHVKNVPGRKTDTSDAAWLCRLLEHGLLRKSFVPPREIREIRDLTRYRKALIRERASEVNRLHKVLEDAGVKLATVASDIMGVSGRKMLAALVGGHDRSRCAGRDGQDQAPRSAAGAAQGAQRQVPRASRVLGRAGPRACRLPRRSDRAGR